MKNINVSEYVLLAEASYADFSKLNNSDSIIEAIVNIGDKEGKQSELVNTQWLANHIVNNYEIKAHWKDWKNKLKESSFSATLFYNKNNNEYILAIKGSKEAKDFLIADLNDIVHDGLAHHQIVDLYNFWQQITTEKKDDAYTAAVIETDDWLTAKYIYRQGFSSEKDENSLDKFLHDNNITDKNYFIDSGVIKKIVFKNSKEVYDDDRAKGFGLRNEISSVVVSGHSLGGHLSAAFSRLFPNITTHAYMVNGAGFGSTGNPLGDKHTDAQANIRNVFATLNGTDNFNSSKITNLIGDKNFDLVANNWNLGLKQPGSY